MSGGNGPRAQPPVMGSEEPIRGNRNMGSRTFPRGFWRSEGVSSNSPTLGSSRTFFPREKLVYVTPDAQARSHSPQSVL